MNIVEDVDFLNQVPTRRDITIGETLDFLCGQCTLTYERYIEITPKGDNEITERRNATSEIICAIEEIGGGRESASQLMRVVAARHLRRTFHEIYAIPLQEFVELPISKLVDRAPN